MAIVDWSKGDIASKLPDHFPKDVPQVLLFGITVLASTVVLSAMIILLLLGTLAEKMIQISLVLAPLSCAMSCMKVLHTGGMGLSALCFLGLIIFGIWYAWSVWHRIPFATANIVVALTAVRAHKGVIPLAFATLLLSLLWTLVWICAVLEVVVFQTEWIQHCSEDQDWDCKWILLGLFLSFCWTSQVISNVLHTTIAGVVGTFWFVGASNRATTDSSSGEPFGTSCCFTSNTNNNSSHDTTIPDSWFRSSVYSFGSICLGSLLVAFAKVLQLVVSLLCCRRSRQDRRESLDPSLCCCLRQYIINQVERLLEYLNSWAFGTLLLVSPRGYRAGV